MKTFFFCLLAGWLSLSPAYAKPALECSQLRRKTIRQCDYGHYLSKSRCFKLYRRTKLNCGADQLCFQLFEPVCGRNPLGDLHTYGNLCSLRLDLARAVKRKAC